MEFKKIQDLIRLFSKSDLSKLKIEDGDFKITLKGNTPITKIITSPQQISNTTSIVEEHQQVEVSTQDEHQPNKKTSKEQPKVNSETDSLITVNSPMIGTFYRSSSPDKPPFIKVGDIVDEGSVLCVIEAMKLFNEIESEVSGKVIKVLIEDANPVEYDQPLFLIDPS